LRRNSAMPSLSCTTSLRRPDLPTHPYPSHLNAATSLRMHETSSLMVHPQSSYQNVIVLGQLVSIVSWATPAPSQIRTSPKEPPLNPSYSQVVKTSPNPQAHDPGKYQVIKSPDLSCDLPTSQVSRDQTACDLGKPLGDLPRDWSPIQS
jgi:hypothetical protein